MAAVTDQAGVTNSNYAANDPNNAWVGTGPGANNTGGAGGMNVGAGITPTQTVQQQAQSFVNPYTAQEQAQINAIPTNQQAGSIAAPQITQSPLAGLTTFGNTAQAGLNTANAANISTAQSNPLLAGQVSQINALNAQAQGQGPSVAQVQAAQQAQQNEAAQMAVLGSQRGSSNPALAQRSAQIAAANANQQAVQAGVLGRTQEEMNAQQQLTGALGTTQGQVMQGAQAQAGLTQQTGLANAAAGNTQQLQNSAAQNQALLQQGSMNQQVNLANQSTQEQNLLANQSTQQAANVANLQAQQQTQGLNTGEYNDMVQAQSALANTNLTASQNYANLVAQQNTSLMGAADQVGINSANNTLGLEGAGIAGGAALGAAGLTAVSDKTRKSNISSADRSVKNFLSKLNVQPASFSLLETSL